VETTAYVLLAIVAVVLALAGLSALLLSFPYSILGMLVAVAIGLLFWKVLKERLANKEDDHYAKNVER
jgi:membrane protein implicated in regulation of membrane protease activity